MGCLFRSVECGDFKWPLQKSSVECVQVYYWTLAWSGRVDKFLFTTSKAIIVKQFNRCAEIGMILKNMQQHTSREQCKCVLNSFVILPEITRIN